MIARIGRRRGLTLLELLIVVAVIGLLAGLTVPAVARIRERANVTACRNNLRQLGLAVHHHHAVKRTMPPYASGKNKEVFGSWFIHLMPYLEQSGVYEAIQAKQTVAAGKIKLAITLSSTPGIGDVPFGVLLCGSDPGRGNNANRTNYLANWYTWGNGLEGAYPPAQSFAQLTDGLSHVVLFGEGYRRCKKTPRPALVSSFYHNFGVTPLGKPSDDPSLAADFTMFQVQPRLSDCDPCAETGHDQMNIALADGSVRSVGSDIAAASWKQLLKPRDNLFPELD